MHYNHPTAGLEFEMTEELLKMPDELDVYLVPIQTSQMLTFADPMGKSIAHARYTRATPEVTDDAVMSCLNDIEQELLDQYGLGGNEKLFDKVKKIRNALLTKTDQASNAGESEGA